MAIFRFIIIIIPFISYPYLIRVVGSENFGLVVYALSITAFFKVCVKFGLEIPAIKFVAESASNKSELSKIVSTILILQLLFFVIGILILTLLIFIFSQFKEIQYILYFSYFFILCEILSCLFLFQGLEKMKYAVISNAISGIFGLVLIFIFIQSESDYIYIPILQTTSLLVGASYSLWIVFFKEGLVFKLPSKIDCKKYLKESFPFLVSRFGLVFNSEISILLLANSVSMQYVAYYDLIKKIIVALRTPSSIITQAMYPYIAKTKDKILAKNIFYIGILVSLLLIGFVYAYGDHIVILLGGESMRPAIGPLTLYSCILFFTFISYYSGSTLLVSFGHSDKFNSSIILSLIVNLTLTTMLYVTNNINFENIIALVVIIEAYVAFYRVYFCKKYQIL
jgi:polysaccharide transporter, PST family